MFNTVTKNDIYFSKFTGLYLTAALILFSGLYAHAQSNLENSNPENCAGEIASYKLLPRDPSAATLTEQYGSVVSENFTAEQIQELKEQFCSEASKVIRNEYGGNALPYRHCMKAGFEVRTKDNLKYIAVAYSIVPAGMELLSRDIEYTNTALALMKKVRRGGKDVVKFEHFALLGVTE